MASAFQLGAFQVGAFQMDVVNEAETIRGFDETLAAFALQRRREREEREVVELFALEAEMIIRAIRPFLGGGHAFPNPETGRERGSRTR